MEKTRNVEFDKASLKLYIRPVLRKWLLKEKNTIKETLWWSALEQLERCPGTLPIRSSILWKCKLTCKERASTENVTKMAPLRENSWVGYFFKDHHIEATPVCGGRLHFQLAAEPGSTVYLVLVLQARMTQGWGIREVCTKVPEATEARQRTAISVSAKKHQELTAWNCGSEVQVGEESPGWRRCQDHRMSPKKSYRHGELA